METQWCARWYSRSPQDSENLVPLAPRPIVSKEQGAIWLTGAREGVLRLVVCPMIIDCRYNNNLLSRRH